MKFTNYVKIEQMKNMIMMHLEKMGLREQVRVMTDEDLTKVMALLGLMGHQLEIIKDEEHRTEMLVSYIVCLWVKLIVDYGADLKEL